MRKTRMPVYLKRRHYRYCLQWQKPLPWREFASVVKWISTREWSEFHARMKWVNSKCSSVQLRANSVIYSRKSRLVWTHSNRPLRSLGSSQLEITRVHTKQGDSAFSYYATHSWNQLPEEIRGPFSYVAYFIWDDLKDSRSSNPDNWSLANLVLQMNLRIRLKYLD